MQTISRRFILFLATVDTHIFSFHLPFMRMLESLGYTVEVAARDTGFRGEMAPRATSVLQPILMECWHRYLQENRFCKKGVPDLEPSLKV